MTVRKPPLKKQVEMLKAALLQEGAAIGSGNAHEVIAKLNGYSSWNVASKDVSVAKSTDKQADDSCMSATYEINMVEVLPEYDTPEEIEAWDWVKALASFSHVENGIGDGIWEFMVRTEKVPADLSTVPAVLHETLQKAMAKKPKWLLFYQW